MEGKAKEAPSTRNQAVGGSIPLEDLLKLLECPVCISYPEPENIRQCQNGHYICTDCFRRLKKCPLCRKKLEHEIRTFDQETIDIIKKELRHLENYRAMVCPEVIVKIFRCEDCKFTSTMAPVFQCSKGHLYCYRCPSLGINCKSCIIKYDCTTSSFPHLPLGIHSLAAQEILCLVPKPCRFRSYGCSTMVGSLEQHEENCAFAENRCIIPHCQSRVTMPKILTHILEECRLAPKVLISADPCHFTDRCYGALALRSKPNAWLHYYSRVAILKLGGDNYFSFSCYALVRYTVYFYTLFWGVPKEAKNYHYTMKLKHDGSVIERKAPVIPVSKLRYHHSNICTHRDVIRIDISELRKTLNINTPVPKFYFEVRVLKNE